MRGQIPSVAAAALGLGLIAAVPGLAQDAGDLASATANPVSDLATIPFQFNYDEGFGSEDGARRILNIQPVVPLSLGEDWNLIVRTIIPLVDSEEFFPGVDGPSGVGDVVQTFFFSPKQARNGFTWGAGPVLLWPTATDESLGGDTFGIGPSAVGLMQSGPWTYGGLFNHVWSVNADEDDDISATFLQPFVSYALPSGTSFFLNSESTYDWEAEAWSVPINFGVNQVVPLGGQIIQVGVGARYWAEAPDNGPEGWGLRLNFNLLFPRG